MDITKQMQKAFPGIDIVRARATPAPTKANAELSIHKGNLALALLAVFAWGVIAGVALG